MGRTPTQHRQDHRAFIVLLIVFITLVNFGCSPSGNNANTNSATASATPTPAQIVIPPWPNGFPSSLPPAVVSGNLLWAVPLPASADSALQVRPNFDYFSWESFIALNWPAGSSRGVPNQPNNSSVFLNAPVGTPVVWGTYKDSFDLFGQKDQRPSPWDSVDSPIKPCPNAPAGQKTLIFTTKGDTALMSTQQAFSFPLIDQRGNLVYYDIRYNQAEYNFIRGQDSDPTSWLYLLKNLAPKENAQFGVQMPMTTATPTNTPGSIMVKAAWRLKTDKDDASRYYSTTAQIYNQQTKSCSSTTVLLVGLHIANKIDPLTEWVWSSFEQVDNVPADSDVTPKPSPPPAGYSFNNGTNDPPTTGGFSYKPPVSPTPCPTPGDPSKICPTPVQVTRVNPIPNTPTPGSTRELNTYYQQLLKGTVWQYYQLVITQWPFNPGIGPGTPFKLMGNGGIYPQNAGSAFPVNGAVNTTMETYFQSQNDAAGAGGNSCMSCHYRAGQSDFSWGLNRRAHN